MFDPRESIMFSISTGELERRWALARDVMREQKNDYLLMRGDEEFLGGYVRWFTDVPARHGYPYTVIFPKDEEMTIISVGPIPPRNPAPPPWAVRGIQKRLSAPYFPTAHYTHTYDAELAVSALKGKMGAVIGLVGKSFIPMNFYECLTKNILAANSEFLEKRGYKPELRLYAHGQGYDLVERPFFLKDETMTIKALRSKLRGMRSLPNSGRNEHHGASCGGDQYNLVHGRRHDRCLYPAGGEDISGKPETISKGGKAGAH